jgi:hypothetical protein
MGRRWASQGQGVRLKQLLLWVTGSDVLDADTGPLTVTPTASASSFCEAATCTRTLRCVDWLALASLGIQPFNRTFWVNQSCLD